MKLVNINCPKCGEVMNVKKENGYDIAICPECASRYMIRQNIHQEDTNEENFKLISINCPNCGEVMNIQQENGFDIVTCPECATKFIIQKEKLQKELENEIIDQYKSEEEYKKLKKEQSQYLAWFIICVLPFMIVIENSKSGFTGINGWVSNILVCLSILLLFSYIKADKRKKELEKILRKDQK